MMRDSSPPEAIRASGRSSSPGLGESRNSARSRPRSVHSVGSDRGLGVRGREEHLEPRLLHGELRELGLHPLAQLERRGPAPPLREGPRPLEVGRRQPLAARLERPLLLLRRGQRVQLRRQRSPNASTSSTVAPYFFLSRSTMRQAALDLVEAARAHLELLVVVAQPQRQVLERREGVRPRLEEALGTRGRSRRGPRPAGRPGRGARAPPPRRRRAGRTPRRSAPRGGPRWPVAPSRRAAPPPRPPARPARSISFAWNSSISRRRSASRRSPRRRSSAASAARRSRKNSASGRPSSAPAKWSSSSRCVDGVEQALGLVLAVDDREPRREVAEEAHGHEGAVHRGAALSARLQLAPHARPRRRPRSARAPRGAPPRLRPRRRPRPQPALRPTG